MMTSVNTVIIGKQVATTTDVNTMNEGDVALFDENRNIISAAKAAEASSIYVGVAGKKIKVTMPDGTVKDKANVEFSNEIQRAGKPSAVIGAYEAPQAEKIAISLSGSEITKGYRYVIRIVYKDMEINKFQFTHSYEVYAESNAVADLIAALVKKINAHANRRVQAEGTNNTIVLTAFEKPVGDINGLNEYSTVAMDASIYQTIPGALLANQPEAVPGAKIVKTPGKPGKGYWAQVRDAEVRNMGYKGHVFTGAYPSIEQDRKTVEGAEYDYATIKCDNPYLSNDNQYIKTTPMTVEVYCPGLVGSAIETGIKSFLNGSSAAAASVEA